MSFLTGQPSRASFSEHFPTPLFQPIVSSSMLTLRQVFFLWFPLAAMWALMSLEGPVVQSVAARAAEPELNLAAYGYAFFSMLLLEAPVFMFLSASNALVKGPLSYERFRNYTYLISGALSVGVLVFALTGLFYVVSTRYVGMSEDLARLSEQCLLCLSVAPLMVGYRRFHQGILVKSRKSAWIAWGGVLRILFGASIAFSLFFYTNLPGGVIACLTLSIAIIFEAYFIRWRSSIVMRELTSNPLPGDKSLSLREMNKFYVPLAVSSVVNIGVQPVLTFFLAQCLDSVQALAVWPVLMSFQFIFMGPTIAFQDIVIAHRHEDEGNGTVLGWFGLCIAIGLGSLAVAFLLSPFYEVWFVQMVGLTPELSRYMFGASTFAIALSLLGTWVSWLRGVHTLEHSTRQIFIGSSIELFSTFMIMWTFVEYSVFPGAFAGILSFTIARFLNCCYMWTVRYGVFGIRTPKAPVL